jgi:glutamate/tyrosine decarboxylase-like PLP-dependent enzyme
LALGEKNVLRVPIDADHRMDLHALDSVIDQQRADGKHVLACVAYAGGSRSMRVDNLDAIAAVLKRKNVWFHVDSCHGSQLAFSRTHKHKINGIERVDSVTIDPHKVLWISTRALSFCSKTQLHYRISLLTQT